MASTYSPNLALELIGTGDQAGTWGNTTNTNLGTLIEQSISGYVTQAVSTGTDTTITIPNGATGVARNMYIELTGTGGASTNLIVPANKKLYFIFNNTSSGQVTVKVSGQTGISVPNKAKVILVSNGTDIVDATNYIGSAVIGNLTATSGTITTLASTSAAITTVSGTTLTYASGTITNLTATSLTLSNNPVLSGGTANGVLYLNGSKVATSGSALTFDGTNLGIGTTSPTSKLSITTDSGTSGLTGYGISLQDTSTTSGDIIPITFTFQSSAGRARAGIGGISQVADAVQGYGGAIGFYTRAAADASNLSSSDERMRLDSSGNLGIGTSSPTTRLTVSGTTTVNTAADATAGLVVKTFGAAGGTQPIANFQRSDAAINFQIGYNGTTGDAYLGTTTNHNLLLITNNTTKATLDTSGNLGLGVTPSAWGGNAKGMQLTNYGSVSGNATTGIASLASNAYESANSTWNRVNATSAGLYQVSYTGAHTWSYAGAATAGSAISWTQAMTLDASGNLGVGVTDPATYGKFVTYSSSGYAAISSNGQITSYQLLDVATAGGRLTGGSSQGELGQIAIEQAATGAKGGYIRFSTCASGSNSSTERARITAGGYFKASDNGTYTNATSTRHEFNQSIDESCLVIAPTNASFTSSGLFISASRAANAAYYMIRARANAVDQFYVTGDGVIYAQNTTVQSVSDKRLKENVIDATDGLDVINALRPVRYDWKAGYGNNRKNQLGFLAQEVEAVFPDAVGEWAKADRDEEAYKTVGPGALIPVLVKAIQELTARVAALESK